MKPVIWLLTREINAYDQEGEYFVAAFSALPTKEQLQQAGVPDWAKGANSVYYLTHVQQGGGRVDYEDEWFHLVEYELQ